MLDTVKECILKNLNKGNVRVHFSKVDYPDDTEYDVLCGVYKDNMLVDVFEFADTTNKQVDEYTIELKEFVRKNTLYLI